ncbi:MAG TPA: hypothetical protein PLD25_12430 [Chloroflexota bacterium]|nr:hypothetical protein [Chloroflexota bacterium]HUM69511.1 hypothetical protein [Chloroflexota bacterium]
MNDHFPIVVYEIFIVARKTGFKDNGLQISRNVISFVVQQLNITDQGELPHHVLWCVLFLCCDGVLADLSQRSLLLLG